MSDSCVFMLFFFFFFFFSFSYSILIHNDRPEKPHFKCKTYVIAMYHALMESTHEKTNSFGFWPGMTQTSLNIH